MKGRLITHLITRFLRSLYRLHSDVFIASTVRILNQFTCIETFKFEKQLANGAFLKTRLPTEQISLLLTILPERLQIVSWIFENYFFGTWSSSEHFRFNPYCKPFCFVSNKCHQVNLFHCASMAQLFLTT